MYVNLPPPRCSKCGSIRSESFVRIVGGAESGIRCLDCKHEVVKARPSDHGDWFRWQLTTKENVF